MSDGGPALGIIADDLTGASDIGGTLTRAGARCRLAVGVPDRPVGAGTDVVIVALKSRSAPVAEAVAQSLAALATLSEAGARQFVFKICSTFDSTPAGNIGPVTEALLDALGAAGAPVCPAFPANGRTVYQGHLFVGDRLLSESGMERHPLTPMTDPDLRRWLALQMKAPVGHLPLGTLRAADARAELLKRFARNERAVICDALEDADLVRLGQISLGLPLLVGGSAIALGLPEALGIHPQPPERLPRAAGYGTGAILAGSCSAATLGQIEAHAARHPVLRMSAEEMTELADAVARATAFLVTHRAERPLVASSADPAQVRAAQDRFGREAIAQAFDRFFATLARSARDAGFDALVVAGGETSGAVAASLSNGAFDIGQEIAPGVPTLYPAEKPAFGLVLKSGNFGGRDFFDAALDALARGT